MLASLSPKRLIGMALPTAFTDVPTQEQLLSHFQQQSEKVTQLKSNVRVSMAGIPTKLRGTLTIERPLRFRLKAGVLGVSEMGIDVGSNDERFWIWTKASLPGETPTLYYATHTGFEQSAVRKAIPIKPEWLIDAMGLLNPLPGDQFVGPEVREDGRLLLYTYRQTSTGVSIRRSVIDPKTGLILQQGIYDESGKLIAYANASDHKTYEDAGVTLPQTIDLMVPQPNGQTMTLTLRSDDYSINAIYGDPAKLWAMPNPLDVPKVDLTRMTPQQNHTAQSAAGF